MQRVLCVCVCVCVHSSATRAKFGPRLPCGRGRRCPVSRAASILVWYLRIVSYVGLRWSTTLMPSITLVPTAAQVVLRGHHSRGRHAEGCAGVCTHVPAVYASLVRVYAVTAYTLLCVSRMRVGEGFATSGDPVAKWSCSFGRCHSILMPGLSLRAGDVASLYLNHSAPDDKIALRSCIQPVSCVVDEVSLILARSVYTQVQLAATGILFSTHSLVFMAISGFSGAAQTRIANLLGENSMSTSQGLSTQSPQN